MPQACPQAHQWLRSTLFQWLQPLPAHNTRQSLHHSSIRHVSTTSAIKRGLRAEGEQGSRPRQNSRQQRGRELITKFASNDQVRLRRGPWLKVRQAMERYQQDPGGMKERAERTGNTSYDRPRRSSLNRLHIHKHGARERTANSVRDSSNLEMEESNTAAVDSWNNLKIKQISQSGKQVSEMPDFEETAEVQSAKLQPEEEKYRDILRQLHTIHDAEKPGSKANPARKRSAEAKLVKLIEDLNAVPKAARRRVLEAVLGPHDSHLSSAAQKKRALWYKSQGQPREVPKTVVWLDRRGGSVHVVRADPLDYEHLSANPPRGPGVKEVKDFMERKVENQKRDDGQPNWKEVKAFMESQMKDKTRKNGQADWDELKDWIQGQFKKMNSQSYRQDRRKDAKTETPKDETPLSVPYTTAASTFIYGTNSVLASLSAKRRKFYHLYLHHASMNEASEKKSLEQIKSLANEADLLTTTNASKALLDKMSNNRPHNGVVLEVSPVPAPPVLGVGKPDSRLSVMPLQLDRQSAEDVVVNGAPTALPTLTNTWRHPFILMLDGVLDEGNMGNILRTAYFYGVDAIAISKNTCASVNSSVVSKASSGAIEAVQILSLPFPTKFIYNSSRASASWRVYAAVSPMVPQFTPAKDQAKYVTHAAISANSPLRSHPCILMLGAEGEGLRENLKSRADYFVSIEHGQRAEGQGAILPGIGVDSMNVSSAAGVLVESFMRKPEGAKSLGFRGRRV